MDVDVNMDATAAGPEALLDSLRSAFYSGHGDILHTVDTLSASMSHSVAPVILAFLHDFLLNERPLPPSTAHEPIFSAIRQRLLPALREHLPSDLHHIVDVLGFEHVPPASVQQDFLLQIQQLITETLVRTSTAELTNTVNRQAADAEEPEYDAYDISPILIYYLENTDDIRAVVRHLSGLVTVESVPSVLRYLSTDPCHAEALFIGIQCLNKPVYEQICSLVLSEKAFFRPRLVSSLPHLDIARVVENIRDYNWDVLSELIQARPDALEHLAASIREGTLKVSRRFLLDRIVAQAEIFSYYVTDLSLTEEELIQLSSRSLLLCGSYFEGITGEGQAEKMRAFCEMLSKKPEAVILEFIRTNKDKPNAPHMPLFIQTLTTVMRFTGGLKEFVIGEFARKREYFHLLITYLKMDDVEELLDQYYEPRKSIEGLLRRFHPPDLLIELHRFHNPLLASKLINECLSLSTFSDRDWVFLLKSLQSSGPGSPVRMKTCAALLESKPWLKREAVDFLSKSMGSDIAHPQMSFVGFLKCLETLGLDAVPVLRRLSDRELLLCLEKSAELKKTMEEYLSSHGSEETPFSGVLRDCLSRAHAQTSRR